MSTEGITLIATYIYYHIYTQERLKNTYRTVRTYQYAAYNKRYLYVFISDII
jgi:hypothetical protein